MGASGIYFAKTGAPSGFSHLEAVERCRLAEKSSPRGELLARDECPALAHALFLFDYEHRFEACVPKEKRLFGYFTLPGLVADEVVAAIDLRTDHEKQATHARMDLDRSWFASITEGAN